MNLAEQAITTATVMAIDTVTVTRWIVTAQKDAIILNLMVVGVIHLKGMFDCAVSVGDNIAGSSKIVRSTYYYCHVLSLNREGSSNENNPSAPGSNGGELQRRYCPCCYCELFGHNGVSDD